MMLRTLTAMTAAILCALCVPATAGAATLTVDPGDDNNACNRTTDTRCKTISQAVSAAETKDLIEVREGTYAETVTVPSGKPELTIRGVGDAGRTRVAPAAGTDTFTVSAARTTVSGLTVEAPAAGESALVVAAADALVRGVAVLRSSTTQSAQPAVEVTTGPARLEQVFVVQNAGPAASPAIVSTAAAGLALSDAFVVSAKGDGLRLSRSDANTLVRTQVLAPVGDASAVRIDSASNDATAKKLVADSSVLSGGAAGGHGLLVRTAGAAVPASTAGDVTVEGRHLTVAGAQNGVVLDASAANGSPLGTGAGNITGAFTASILHGANRAEQFAGGTTTGAPNSAKLSCTRCDGPKPVGDGTIAWPEGTPSTPDAQLFRRSTFLLRADAPVVDRGGAADLGASDRDVDREPRTAGPATDIGADEFHNRPPKAAFGITNASPAEGEATGFISGSTDPEAEHGGRIAKYRWDFGDGTVEETAVGGVAHTYAQRGQYTVRLTVVDDRGLEATAEPQTVTVRDGRPPTVGILSPAQGAVLSLSERTVTRKCAKRRKGSRRGPRCPKPRTIRAKPFGAAGNASDEAGVAAVEYSLRLVQRSKVRRTATRVGDAARRRRARRSQAPACRYFDGGRTLTARPCTDPLWRPAALRDGLWSFAAVAGVLPPGRYELRVRATDANGNASPAPSRPSRTVVTFRVK